MIAPKLFTLFAAGLAFAAAYIFATDEADVAFGLLALAVFWLAAALWLWMMRHNGEIPG